MITTKDIIGFRVTPKLKEMIQELEESGLYLDRSELLRDAVRLLYEQKLLKGGSKNV